MTRVLLTARHRIDDIRSWSGSSWHIARELRQRFDVQVADSPTPRLDRIVHGSLGRRVPGMAPIDLRRNRATGWLTERAVRAQRVALRADAHVAIAAAQHLVADSGIPQIYVSDNVYALQADVFERVHGPMPARARRRRLSLESSLLQRADLLAVPSYAAARAAVEAHGVRPERVVVAPFGANLADLDPTPHVAGSHAGPLQLVFIGVSWQHKGGPLLLDAMRILRSRGIDYELHLVGAEPTGDHTLWHSHRRIDKTHPAGLLELAHLLDRADLLVFPTRADAYGVVVCEAAAFGVPTIATRLEGTSTTIEHGVTGLLVDLESGAEEWADAIATYADDRQALQRASVGARHRYERLLNWQAWGDTVAATIRQVSGHVHEHQ